MERIEKGRRGAGGLKREERQTPNLRELNSIIASVRFIHHKRIFRATGGGTLHRPFQVVTGGETLFQQRF